MKLSNRIALLAAAWALAGAVSFAASPGDAVVAVVEGEVITVHDVHEYTAQEELRLKSLLPTGDQRQQIAELRRLAVRRLIDRELVYAEFQKLGGKVPLEALQDRIDRLVISRSGGDRVAFEALLADEGMTYTEFEDKIRKQTAVDMLLHDRVYRQIVIGPERIEAFYVERSGDLAEKPGVRLQTIMLKKAGGRHSDRLDAAAAEIYEKLKAGAAFDELARTWSEGPKAEDGGDQGWITSPSGALLEAIRDLKPGEVTPKPVDLGSNLYILKVIERREARVPPLDDALRRRIEEILRREEENRRYDTFLGELRRKYHVKTPEDFDRGN